MLGFLQGGGPGQGFMLSVLPEHDPALVTHKAERRSVPFAQCERCMLTMSVDITQCARHMKSPGEPGGVYGATRLKQHSDVFSSSYRVLQSNISVDRNKYTERTPW